MTDDKYKQMWEELKASCIDRRNYFAGLLRMPNFSHGTRSDYEQCQIEIELVLGNMARIGNKYSPTLEDLCRELTTKAFILVDNSNVFANSYGVPSNAVDAIRNHLARVDKEKGE